MTDELLSKKDKGVLVLTMNRPDAMNALTPTMMQAQLDALSAAAADPEVGCVVMTGNGRAFCAGGDVKSMASGERRGTLEERANDLRRRMEVSRLLHEMPKPTIAMVNGVAAGAGMSIALACDMRVVAKSARMTTAFAKVGFSGDFAGHYFLHRMIGTARARELYFTAEVLDSAKIDALGLANRVVADDQLEAETMKLAHQVANGPRVAWGYMKRNMKAAEEGTLSEVMDLEAFGMMRCADTDDHKEAARAFVEKRAPVFKGR
jgi:2-(1,2-epoxy-1,2-dihydrophenyl)acetyl-CoA isomerase